MTPDFTVFKFTFVLLGGIWFGLLVVILNLMEHRDVKVILCDVDQPFSQEYLSILELICIKEIIRGADINTIESNAIGYGKDHVI